MSGKIVGMKMGGGNDLVPRYNVKKLFEASKGVSRIKLIRTAMGTIKRKIKGSI